MTTPRGGGLALLFLAFLAFVSLGLPDGVLGVAWPSIRTSFDLPLDALGSLLLATTLSYVTSSFASGWLLGRIGLGALLALSCVLTAASLVGYATAPTWGSVIGFALVAGLGASAIDAALNTYVAAHHGARTLHLLHAFYGLGTTAGPAIITSVLLAGSSWRRGYAAIGLAQLALALALAATRRRWPPAGPARAVASSPPLLETLRLRAVRLGVATFFLYVGIEAAAGAWIYSLLHQARGVPMGVGGTAVSLFWGGLLVGRLAFGLVPERRHPAGLASYGAACGPIFPALIATTPRRLGAAHATNAMGFQVAGAALGQSMIPAAIGIAAQRWGLERVPAILVIAAIALALAIYRLERPR